MSGLTRLAPSPTGAQHLGNLRTYLIAWLAARARGDRVLLRIEDIDSPRVKPSAVRQIFDDFRWLGLDWDVGPVTQTERMTHYEVALRRLQEAERVYPCDCTRTDVERAASAPHLEHEGPVYPGTCAGRRVADAPTLGDVAWRARIADAAYAWDDGFRGPERRTLAQVGGDFVVWKSAGTPAYQLAVVVDDADLGVTDVVRGDDLVPSTPRQLWLYDALGRTPPRFFHVPLVVGPDGRRLAKRHGDTRVEAYRHAGVAPEQLLGLMAWSCGWLDRPTPVRLAELSPLFRWDTIPKTPFVLTPDLEPRATAERHAAREASAERDCGHFSR